MFHRFSFGLYGNKVSEFPRTSCPKGCGVRRRIIWTKDIANIILGENVPKPTTCITTPGCGKCVQPPLAATMNLYNRTNGYERVQKDQWSY